MNSKLNKKSREIMKTFEMKEEFNELEICILAYLTKMGYTDDESKELYDGIFDRLERFAKIYIHD